jgi:putative nucleotidyltransferase with HDIG domain
MLSIFERKRLVKKGLASPKTRRRRSHNELLQTLETGLLARCLLFLAFVIGLALLVFYGNHTAPAHKFVIALLVFLTALGQLWINHPNTWARNSRILLMLGLFMLYLVLTKSILSFFAGLATDPRFGPEMMRWGVLVMPYAMVPLILSVLLSRNHGVYATIFVSLLGSVVLPETQVNPAIYLVMSLISGFIAVFVTLQVRKRSRLIRAGIFVGLATSLLAIIFGLVGPINWAGETHWRTIFYQSLTPVASAMLTAILVTGLLPILESMFKITTDISWLEAADLNHPLLRRMTLESPGTYHHSLIVANLAEAAAEAVGANPTICRVCSYFHDIGKLVKPEYFTENTPLDRNPHHDLAPTMSALIIIAHVKEGVDLALKHNLNKQIIDVIQQHHGTSIVSYFYKRALQQQEDARAGGKIMNIREEDIPEVREESFRYSGPKPQTRECAIISLADAVESASRSLEKVTPQKVDQLVGDIIERRILEGQLEECPLTLRELKVIHESFVFTLQNMLHRRIAYPSDKPATGTVEPIMRPPTVNVPPVSAA